MRTIFLTAATALTLLGTSAMAEQLTYPIVDTDQTLCYDNSRAITAPAVGEPFYGQDAQHIGHTPSYTDNGDGTITDNVTKLMWQRGYIVTSYDEAIAIAKELTYAGYSDWRVPTIKEAYSLIQFSGTDVSSADMSYTPEAAVPFIASSYFDFAYGSNGTRSIDTQLLSSTAFVGSSSRETLLFGVNLADGRIKGYPKMMRGTAKTYTVRFVRGESYGENNFEANGDGTVSDHATGLMWQQSDSGRGLDWQSALEYAAQMNAEGYLGYNDWRVPNAKELQSIVDYTRSPESSSSGAIDLKFAITEIVNEGGEADYPFFWSSTTHCSAMPRSGASAAAYVSFGRALGNMANMQQQQRQRQNTNTTQRQNWVNIHGAGAQRSDPKSGDASKFTNGRGPQGDAIRIENFVRLVRDM